MKLVRRITWVTWLVFIASLAPSIAPAQADRSAPPGASAASDDDALPDFELVVDVAALRRGSMGPLAEAGLLATIFTIEGSLPGRDEPALEIDRIACAQPHGGEPVCHVYGRFAPALEAAQRALSRTPRGPFPLVTGVDRSPPAAPAPAPAPAPEASVTDDPTGLQQALGGLVASFATATVFPCDGAHWVLAWARPTAADCRAPSLPIETDRAYEGTAFSSVVRHPLLGEHARFESIGLGIRDGEPPLSEARFEFSQEEETTLAEGRLREAVRNGSLFDPLPAAVRTFYGASRIDRQDAVVVLTTELDFAGGMQTFLAGEPLPDADAALEPLAEMDDARARSLRHYPGGAYRLASASAANARPVVFLAPTPWDARAQVAEALAKKYGRTFLVLPDGRLPYDAFVWTRHGADALAYVNGALAAARDGGPELCAAGCVLVATLDSVETAIELATLDPVHFPSVVAVNPHRTLPLAPLATIARAASGVSLVFVATDGMDRHLAEPEAFASRWATLTRASAHESPELTLTQAVDAAFARAPVRARAGVVAALPSGGSRACRAALGRGPACRHAPPAAATESDLADLALACHVGERGACTELRDAWVVLTTDPAHQRQAGLPTTLGCARGDGSACGRLADDFRDSGNPLFAMARALLLRQACDDGEGRSCEGLAYAYYAGQALAVSPFDEIRLHARACELGDAFACGNLAVRRGDALPSLDADRRGALEQAMCRAGEWDRCSTGLASGDEAERTFAAEHLRAGCAFGDWETCLAWRAQSPPAAEREAIARLGCAQGLDEECDEAGFDDAAEASAARDALLGVAERACDAGERYGCFAAQRLLADSPATDAGARRAHALARACLLGATAACDEAVATPEPATATEVRQFACLFDVPGACDARSNDTEGSR